MNKETNKCSNCNITESGYNKLSEYNKLEELPDYDLDFEIGGSYCNNCKKFITLVIKSPI